MQKIRVLVANRPRLMKRLGPGNGNWRSARVSKSSGETRNEAEITRTWLSARVLILRVLALEDPEVPAYSNFCGFLLGRYPEMKILALALYERNSGIYHWAFCRYPFRRIRRIIRAGHLKRFAK